MNTETQPAVDGRVARNVRPMFENGFWWWYDRVRNGWFTGCAPAFGVPTWAR